MSQFRIEFHVNHDERSEIMCIGGQKEGDDRMMGGGVLSLVK